MIRKMTKKLTRRMIIQMTMTIKAVRQVVWIQAARIRAMKEG